MRAGPLSNDQIIRLLNDRFVAVYVSNEDYVEDGPAPAEEREERNRIWRETRAAGLSAGTVHAYVLSPEGAVWDSLHVAEAAKVERTRAMLERAAQRAAAPADRTPPAVQPRPAVPQAPQGGLVLHLTARYLKREGGELVTLVDDAGLGQTRNASWQAYPAENWIVLDSREVDKLLPSRPVAAGDTWAPDARTLGRLLVFFYPSTECNDAERNRIEEQRLTATVTAVEPGVVRARLDGHLRMRHHFYPGREDQNFVTATLQGYLDFDPRARHIRALRLITPEATYARWPFGVAVTSLEP